MNIKFGYLYRDASNYKNFSEIIFSNPSAVSVEAVETFIREHLIEDGWFYSTEWGVPDLHFDNWDPDDDHSWHEYDFVKGVDDEPNVDMTVDAFLQKIEASQRL